MGREALVALDRFGLLTNRQIAAYLFQDRPNQHGQIRTVAAANLAANRYCLIRLKDRGLIRRLPVILRSAPTGALYQGMVNTLTPAGAQVVADYYETLGYGTPQWTRTVAEVANQQIAHRMAINDLVIHLQRACWQTTVTLVNWWGDRELAAMKELTFAAIPDIFVVLQPPSASPHGIFVEIDRGTETLIGIETQRRDWRRKVQGYLDYLAPTGPWQRHEFYHGLTSPPLVATITTTPARLNGMLEATRAVGGDERFWYTTAAELAIPEAPARLWQPIWRRTGDSVLHTLTEYLALYRPI